MNQIAQRITAILAVSPEDMAMRIKQEAPTLADLNKEQLEQIARLVMAQRLTAELNVKVDLAGIDYKAERETFLNNAGRTKSGHTAKAYRAGIDRMETWTAVQGINVLELTPAQADDFIYSLRDSRASASIRLDVAAASSFFTWLHRRHNSIENPFRGSRARPAQKAVKKIELPAALEVETIIRELPAMLAAAAAVMAYRGLRAGALPTLSITGGKFTGHSKGKDISGIMPAAALDAIKAAALPLHSPFAGTAANTLEQRIIRAVKKLYEVGKLAACYSCHDFRHYYAVTEYKADKDIHRVSKLLGHASIQITETYLRGLGEID
jgi:site-specific recombinase XerD